MTELIPIKQDITTLKVDAIVNAANETLLGGGGVDGAIHSAAGRELDKECAMLGGCKVGEAKITKGYNLPAKFVIHTVGPVYGLDEEHQQGFLQDCYYNSLRLAVKHNVKTIAFPNISTGAFGYPIEAAATIAIASVESFLEKENHNIEKVYFVCFTDKDYEIYKGLLNS